MAKNKTDYRKDGYSEFLHGLPMPFGSSWQELARAEGWIEAQKEAQQHAASGAGAPKKKTTWEGSGVEEKSPLRSYQKDSAESIKVAMQNGAEITFEFEAPSGLFTANKLNKSPTGSLVNVFKQHAQINGRNAVAEHIRLLDIERRGAAAIGNYKRANRLAIKANNLEEKWGL